MRRFAWPVAALCSALFLLLNGTAALAQATRTWVSGVGDDANPCSRTAPCKTFAGAISKTAAGGEINALDSGGFGAVTITKSITIMAEGVVAGVLVAGSNGISVSAGPNDVVVLRGLDIYGGGSASPGLSGIRFLSGRSLYIEKCQIRNFQGVAPNGFGINFIPSGTGDLYVSDTVLTNNGTAVSGGGIQIRPTGALTVKVSVDRVEAKDNFVGILADAGGGAGGMLMSVSNSVTSGNTSSGITARTGAGGGPVVMTVDRVVVSNNGGVAGTTGILADGAAVTVRINNSTIAGNILALSGVNGANLSSYKTNVIDGNVGAGTAPTIIPLN